MKTSASIFVGALILLAGPGPSVFAAGSPALATAPPAPIGHVFIIVLENRNFETTFGAKSEARFLKGLARQGALLPNYYGTGHASLDNYITMISGQAPNPATQADCPIFTDFVSRGTDADGQELGAGCVYPARVATVVNQLETAKRTWKGYMEDMGNNSARESATCGHPAIGARDVTQQATRGDQYAARHNPFVYFHSIIDSPSCATAVVNDKVLAADLASIATTPNFAFISPNLCNDAHDGGNGHPCVDGQPGGLVSADRYLEYVVPMILRSAAFKKDGLLIVTFDEAEMPTGRDRTTGKLKGGDASACCAQPRGPNIPEGQKVFGYPNEGPGIFGPGGGRIGAVLLSPFIKPGTVSNEPYNHYGLLKSIEDIFGLPYLGYAGQPGLKAFGSEIFSRSAPPAR